MYAKTAFLRSEIKNIKNFFFKYKKSYTYYNYIYRCKDAIVVDTGHPLPPNPFS